MLIWGATEYVVRVAGEPWTTIDEMGCSGINWEMPKRAARVPMMVFFCKESSELIRSFWFFKFVSMRERRFSKREKLSGISGFGVSAKEGTKSKASASARVLIEGRYS